MPTLPLYLVVSVSHTELPSPVEVLVTRVDLEFVNGYRLQGGVAATPNGSLYQAMVLAPKESIFKKDT